MKSIKFLKDIGYKNIEYKLYDDMRHAIVLEKNKELVYDDIMKFL